MSTTTTVKKTTRVVKVVKREASNFYDDSFFEDSWGDFDSAIKQILNKFDSETPKIDFGDRTVCKDVYRKIRTENVGKDLYQSQALQVTEKDDKFQCVMDVKDFTPNDLQVKVVEDRVVVDGKFEKVSEDGLSKSSKSFHKEFTLPSAADIEQVSTALSKDGVLTIKAPKMEGGGAVTPSGGEVTSSTQQQSSSSQQTSSTTGDDSSSSVVSSTKKESKSSFSSSSTFSSSKKVSMSSSSSVDMTNASSLGDIMSKDVQDRLVFTHDTVDVKLPAPKE